MMTPTVEPRPEEPEIESITTILGETWCAGDKVDGPDRISVTDITRIQDGTYKGWFRIDFSDSSHLRMNSRSVKNVAFYPPNRRATE